MNIICIQKDRMYRILPMTSLHIKKSNWSAGQVTSVIFFIFPCWSEGGRGVGVFLKRQCHEIFCFMFFPWIIFSQASDLNSNFFDNSRRYSQFKVHQLCRWHWCSHLSGDLHCPPVSLMLVAKLPQVSKIRCKIQTIVFLFSYEGISTTCSTKTTAETPTIALY